MLHPSSTYYLSLYTTQVTLILFYGSLTWLAWIFPSNTCCSAPGWWTIGPAFLGLKRHCIGLMYKDYVNHFRLTTFADN